MLKTAANPTMEGIWPLDPWYAECLAYLSGALVSLLISSHQGTTAAATYRRIERCSDFLTYMLQRLSSEFSAISAVLLLTTAILRYLDIGVSFAGVGFGLLTGSILITPLGRKVIERLREGENE